MKNKEYKNKGIKGYYLASMDGYLTNGIDKKCKKLYTRIARKRLKRELNDIIDNKKT